MKTVSKKFVFKRRGPDLPDEFEAQADNTALFEERDILIADRLIEGVRMENRAAGSLRIESSALEGVSLAGTTFTSTPVRRCSPVRCDPRSKRAALQPSAEPLIAE